jgi:hypothetical protein
MGTFIQNKKCHINKIPAGVSTNAIDLHDTIVYYYINIVPVGGMTPGSSLESIVDWDDIVVVCSRVLVS